MPRTKKAAPAVEPEVKAASEVSAARSATRKTASKSAAPEEEVVIQFAGGEWNLSELREKAIAEFVAEGHQRGRIKKITLYVKPEEHMLYYVFNDKVAGGVDFD